MNQPMPQLTPIQIARFWSKVDVGRADECWEWRGQRDDAGYGRVGISKRNYSTHRVAYSLVRGAISEDAMALHSCDNPPCCNPRHLRPGTALDNARDRAERPPADWSPIRGEGHPRAVLTGASSPHH